MAKKANKAKESEVKNAPVVTKYHSLLVAKVILGKQSREIDLPVSTPSALIKLDDIHQMKAFCVQAIPEAERKKITEVVILNIIPLGVMTDDEFAPKQEVAAQ